MSAADKVYIPLDTAFLCADCQCIGNSANTCPACASGALMGLQSVMDRDERGLTIDARSFHLTVENR